MRFSELLARVALTTLSLFPAITLAATGLTYNRTNFLLNDEPFIFLGGQMDPQRVPAALWGERLRMARAMGLNTIFSYIHWHGVEPAEGKFDWSGSNDIATFIKTAQQEGLNVVLRPGPYVCAETEWGGFPGWLTAVEGMAVRQNNQQFMSLAENYLRELGKQLSGMLAPDDGPILMVQLENEYGNFGSDKDYLGAFVDILKAAFPNIPVYSNDNHWESALAGGSYPGVLAITDGMNPGEQFNARDQYITDESMLGPNFNGEYWVTWYDAWLPDSGHRSINDDEAGQQKTAADVEFMITEASGFSIYMVHGGTNWGFSNGANVDGNNNWRRLAVTTSYDYGAPIDESGRPINTYFTIRDAIAKHVPEGSIPDVPYFPPLIDIPSFDLAPVAEFFPTPAGDPPTHSDDRPFAMEWLGQSYGYVMYQHTATEFMSGQLLPGDKPRDRVIVLVNGVRVGVIDATYKNPNSVQVTLNPGDVLQLLVENLGRINVTGDMVEQSKGIWGDVTVGGIKIVGWWSYSLPCTSLPTETDTIDVQERGKPVWFKGSFILPDGAKADSSSDTYLSITNGYKGVVWVNGHNLGRYWSVGPQQQLYLPGVFLNEGGQANDVVVLELEPESGATYAAVGSNTRTWGNKADPNAS